MTDRGLLLVAPGQGGVKTLNPEALPESAWTYVLGQSTSDSDLTAATAYALVPWVYRAVEMRSVGLADMPWAILKGGTAVVTSLDWKPVKGLEWTRHLRSLLLRTEQARCVYAASYWQAVGNVLGTKTLDYRWLAPDSIAPRYDPDRGVVGWKRKVGNRTLDLDLEDVVYTWLPSLTAELGPGPAPAQVALRAAGIVRNVDRFAEAFFARGALKATILQVPPTAKDEEIRRLENWWKRLVRGVKGAFETVGLRTTVVPTVISSDPKDLAMREIVEGRQRDIAVAMGMPFTLLFSEASNLATAQQDDLNFYTKTLIPEASLIEEALNEQIFDRLGRGGGSSGYWFEFQPQKLEIMQAREAEKAFALIAALNSGAITVNEWRGQMGFGSKPEGETLGAPTANPRFGSAEEAEAEVAADMGASEGQVEGKRSLPALPSPRDQASDARTLDLDRWQRKSLKALKAGRGASVPFESAHISEVDYLLIREQLSDASTPEAVREVFASLPRESVDFPEPTTPPVLAALKDFRAALAEALASDEQAARAREAETNSSTVRALEALALKVSELAARPPVVNVTLPSPKAQGVRRVEDQSGE